MLVFVATVCLRPLQPSCARAHLDATGAVSVAATPFVVRGARHATSLGTQPEKAMR
jgi:hypothetical protein